MKNREVKTEQRNTGIESKETDLDTNGGGAEVIERADAETGSGPELVIGEGLGDPERGPVECGRQGLVVGAEVGGGDRTSRAANG